MLLERKVKMWDQENLSYMMKKLIWNDEKKSLGKEGEKLGWKKLIYDDKKNHLEGKEKKLDKKRIRSKTSLGREGEKLGQKNLYDGKKRCSWNGRRKCRTKPKNSYLIKKSHVEGKEKNLDKKNYMRWWKKSLGREGSEKK